MMIAARMRGQQGPGPITKTPMTTPTRRQILIASAGPALLALAPLAQASSFPERPFNFICPGPPAAPPT